MSRAASSRIYQRQRALGVPRYQAALSARAENKQWLPRPRDGVAAERGGAAPSWQDRRRRVGEITRSLHDAMDTTMRQPSS